ncbi:MAG: DUF1428 domain-containing protein [Pseudomonadota bacterium]
MSYVNAAALPVKTARKQDYQKIAAEMAAVFKKHGAAHVMECWGEDVPDGKITSFPKGLKLKADETVVLSLVIWPSKTAADAGMKAVMEDASMGPHSSAALFDRTRTIFGAFDPIVEL